ncbi:transglycosylase domain-containing protein [Geobacter sp.]|uniref:transglycosylase domain-containing protein n=1 Tax=Geobacter sp. TaxID=46610 RepID=UPI0027B9E097|nr:biosynthetic peptidoglycan transglycosylase [Geobacter sp.]
MNIKKLLYLAIGAVVVYGAYIAVSLMFLPSVEELKNRRMNMTIQVRDWHGEYHPLTVGPKNRYWTPSGSIPAEMKWAVILAEDANFYKHEGIDVKAIKNAIKYDLEKKSFARGASTITQQVAKNLFLSREKTITRKVKEIVLAKRMEEELTKGRIIELYLNVVELGPMVYGIGHGARYYFGKPASALTPRECAFLASMLPGPRVAYNPYKNLDKVLKRSNMILRLLRNKGVLSAGEYQQAMGQEPNIAGLQRKVDVSIERVEAVFENVTGVTGPQEPVPAPVTEGESSSQEAPAATPPPEPAGAAPEGEGGAAAPPVQEEQK